MSDDPTQKIIAGLILLVQSIPIASGSYGGLSGHDSLARSMCTLVDQSVSLLLFYGLFNLSFFTESPKLRLARMDLIHTTRPDAPQLKSTVVSYRARWSDIGNLASRAGQFEVGSSNGGLIDPRDLEAHLPDTTIAPNSNHWIYPYMLGRQPHELEENATPTNGKVVQEITLTRRGLIKTTALAVSRFGVFLGSSIFITLFHIILIAFLFDDKLVKAVLILADIGRWLLVVGQLSSILTYSLDYKGVCSWASPKDFKDEAIYGTTWSKAEQMFCRDQVIHYIGRAYHARAIFYICEYFWPKIARRMTRWRHVWGTEIFSTFKCLDERYFNDDQQSTLLHLHVRPRGTGDLSNDFLSHGSYVVDFRIPTIMVQLFFPNRLIAEFTQRMWNFFVIAPFCLCSIASPFLVIWRDGGPSTPAVIIIAIIQIITYVFNYKDIDQWSINCKFESDDTPHAPTASNPGSNSGGSGAHQYPPNANAVSGSSQNAAASSSSQQAGPSSTTGRTRVRLAPSVPQAPKP
jgi:hypothetical protein